MDYEKRTVTIIYKGLEITVSGQWHPAGYFEDTSIHTDGNLWGLLDTLQTGGSIADEILDLAALAVEVGVGE